MINKALMGCLIGIVLGFGQLATAAASKEEIDAKVREATGIFSNKGLMYNP